MSLELLEMNADDAALEVFALAISLVAMGLEDALHEEPNNPALVPLARELISAYLLKSFGASDHVADLMADSLVSTILKEMDL